VAKWKKRAYLLSEFDVCSSSIVEIDCICNDPGEGKPGDGQNGVGSRGHDGGRRKTVTSFRPCEANSSKSRFGSNPHPASTLHSTRAQRH
jgi:hypothetical protein